MSRETRVGIAIGLSVILLALTVVLTVMLKGRIQPQVLQEAQLVGVWEDDPKNDTLWQSLKSITLNPVSTITMWEFQPGGAMVNYAPAVIPGTWSVRGNILTLTEADSRPRDYECLLSPDGKTLQLSFKLLGQKYSKRLNRVK